MAPEKSLAGKPDKRLGANQAFYEVGPADLPLHCPMPGMSLWDAHPRVYLPIEKSREAKCPYCGAEFRLKID